MKLLAFIISLLAYLTNTVYSQVEENSLFIDLEKNGYSYENMLVVPVYASEQFIKFNENIGDFVNLKKALEDKLIVISERHSQAQRERSINLNEAEAPANAEIPAKND